MFNSLFFPFSVIKIDQRMQFDWLAVRHCRLTKFGSVCKKLGPPDLKSPINL